MNNKNSLQNEPYDHVAMMLTYCFIGFFQKIWKNRFASKYSELTKIDLDRPEGWMNRTQMYCGVSCEIHPERQMSQSR